MFLLTERKKEVLICIVCIPTSLLSVEECLTNKQQTILSPGWAYNNPSIWETEEGESRVPAQPGLHSETVFHKTKSQTKPNNKNNQARVTPTINEICGHLKRMMKLPWKS